METWLFPKKCWGGGGESTPGEEDDERCLVVSPGAVFMSLTGFRRVSPQRQGYLRGQVSLRRPRVPQNNSQSLNLIFNGRWLCWVMGRPFSPRGDGGP